MGKICKECFEEIHESAKKCPNCQAYQGPINRFIKSPFGGALLGLVVGLGVFYYFINSVIFKDDFIHNPEKIVSVGETNFNFKELDCGTKINLLGVVTNSSDKPLRNIVFNVEYFDGEGKTIDVINSERYGLVLPAQSSVKFKVSGTAAVDKERYASSKVVISRVELDNWP